MRMRAGDNTNIQEERQTEEDGLTEVLPIKGRSRVLILQLTEIEEGEEQEDREGEEGR